MTPSIDKSQFDDEYELRLAWRRNDPAIERDAELFWRGNNALPRGEDVERRLSELCAVAYGADGLAAVATARIRTIDFLRTKLAMLRVFVAPGARVQNLARRLTVLCRDALEIWSKQHPEEEVMGVGTVVQSRLVVKNAPFAVYPTTKMIFVGYTQEGYQVRVYWFTHATISTYWPGDDRPGGPQNANEQPGQS